MTLLGEMTLFYGKPQVWIKKMANLNGFDFESLLFWGEK